MSVTEHEPPANEITGNYRVAALVTADGTVIQGSRKIIAWAQADPAATVGRAAAAAAAG